MFKKKRFFMCFTSLIIIFSLLSMTNASVLLAASATSQKDIYYDDEVTIQSQVLNQSEGIISFQYDNPNDDFTIHAYNVGTNNYYSETYDSNNNLLNYIKQEGNELVQYDAQGNEVVRNNLGTSIVDENIGDVSDRAMTWGQKLNHSGDLTADVARGIAFVASVITGLILSKLGITSFYGATIKQLIKDLANRMVVNIIPHVYYKGWTRSGWEYAVHFREVNMNFYKNSNYTGLLKNISGIEQVH